MQIQISIAEFLDEDGNAQVGYKCDPSYPELVRLWKEKAFKNEKQRAALLYAMEAMGAIERVNKEAAKRDQLIKKPGLKPV